MTRRRLVLLLPLVVAACSGGGEERSATTTSGTTSSTEATTTTTTGTPPTTSVAGPAGRAPLDIGGLPVLGFDPETGDGLGLWLHESSPLSPAANGDLFDTDCAGLVTCAPDLPPPRYLVRVPRAGAAPLVVEAYDAIQLPYGIYCQGGGLGPDEQRRLDELDDGLPGPDGAPDPVPIGWYDDAPERFALGRQPLAPRYCPGDRGDATAPLTFEVSDPGGVVVCTRQFPAVAASPLIDLLTDPVQGRVDPTDDGRVEGITVAESFHRWAPVCEVPAADVVAGDYVVAVRTDLGRGGAPVDGHDENEFSLRVRADGPRGAAIRAEGSLTATINSGVLPDLPVLGAESGFAEVTFFDLDSFGQHAAAVLLGRSGGPLGPDEACARVVIPSFGSRFEPEPACRTPDLRSLDGALIGLRADLARTGPLTRLEFSLLDYPSPDTFSMLAILATAEAPTTGPGSPL